VSPASGKTWPFEVISRWLPSTNWRDSQPAAAAAGSSVVGGAAWAGDATTADAVSSARSAAEAAARTRRVGPGTDRATRGRLSAPGPRDEPRGAGTGSRDVADSTTADVPGHRPADLDGMGG